MNPIIRFRSTLLDLAAEPENPINPIPGAIVLECLARQSELLGLSEPSPEDWGWYSHFDHAGRLYMIGACLYPGDSGEHECLIQFDKRRRLMERLAGQAKLDMHDPVVARVLSAVQRIAVPGSVEVEHGP